MSFFQSYYEAMINATIAGSQQGPSARQQLMNATERRELRESADLRLINEVDFANRLLGKQVTESRSSSEFATRLRKI